MTRNLELKDFTGEKLDKIFVKYLDLDLILIVVGFRRFQKNLRLCCVNVRKLVGVQVSDAKCNQRKRQDEVPVFSEEFK